MTSQLARNGRRLARLALAAALAAAAASPALAGLATPGPVAGPAEILGPLAGPGADALPGGLFLYGTDLGWTFEHEGELEILFGDTWMFSNSVCLGEPENDDAAGTLPAAPPALGAPPVTFRTRPAAPTQFDPIVLRRGGEPLRLGYGQVPITGFSDGRDAAAIFGRSEYVRCGRRKGKPTCRPPRAAKGEPRQGPRKKLVCAEDLGACAPAGVVPCDLATGAGCLLGVGCEPAEPGFCIDETSSQLATPADRRFAVAHANDLAIRDPDDPVAFDSVAVWRTNKFINATSRAVARFTKSGKNADYAPGADALLVFGRPGFTGEQGREAQLYLAVLDLPLRKRPGARARFRPLYFAGLKKSGRPRWTRNEARAQPLALDGVAGGSPHEVLPQPLQMGVAWVGEPIGKWVMLYGGDIADYLLADPANASPGPSPGAVRIRFADAPWGPWSVPQPVLAPGDFSEAGDPFGPGGVLYHPQCSDLGPLLCADTDPSRPLHSFDPDCNPPPLEFDVGGFYGSNVIDAWTQPDGAGGVYLYWNVSTWNPYGVLLVRTRISP